MVRRGVVVVLAVAGVALAVVTRVTRPGTVYTVAQVAAGLAQHPHAWVGRTVTMRGTLVVAEGQNVSGGIVNGMWWSSCPVERCSFGVPTGAPFHMVLVAHGPYRVAADTQPPPPMPAPRLVVLVPARRVQPAWARLSRAVQQAASNLPDGSWTTLAQLPLLGPFLGQLLMPGMVQGGTPRTYRVRLLSPAPTTRRAGCPLVCDDAVLLDNLS